MTVKRLWSYTIKITFFLLWVPFYGLSAQPDVIGGWQNSGWPKADLTAYGWFRYNGINHSATLETDLNQWQPSGHVKNDRFEITGGWRDLPSNSQFYSDLKFPVGFLPPKRRSNLLFFRILSRWFIPGLWFSKDLKGIGLYFATERVFFAFQPKLKIWGATIKDEYVVIDAEGEHKNFQGYGRLRSWSSDEEKKSRSFLIEAERRSYWDRFRYREQRTENPTELDSKFLENSAYREEWKSNEATFSQSSLFTVKKRERQYRSGMMLAETRIDFIHFLSAGMDHGDVGFRLSRLRRNVANLDSGWYWLPEFSYYQIQIYEEDIILKENRLGIGIANQSRQGNLEAILRFSDTQSINLELSGSFRPNRDDIGFSNLWIQPTFVFTHTSQLDSFEYMALIESTDGQARFIERARYAFGLRAYSDNLRIVFFYYGKKPDSDAIKDWGYLRLEFQQKF